jgi:hypothetical protein
VPSALRTGLGRFNLTLLGIAIFCATFWFTDQAVNPHPMAPGVVPADVAARRAMNSHRPRIYIFIIDSLRYETAVNPAIMPNLGALAQEGAYARVRSGFNSLTSTALRNAFTGYENSSVMAVVSNFLKSDAGVDSIFHQMAAEGIITAAYSQGFFRQFGSGVAFEGEVRRRAPEEEEEHNVLLGADQLRAGEYDVVVGHIAYTDYGSHVYGIGRREYREMFSRADALIPRIRAKLPPGATFMVMGDHGHNETGQHTFGLEVPTFTVYTGPRFRRGADLGEISLTTHRYLLSEAAGLPLKRDGYTGEVVPAALSDDGHTLTARLTDVLAGAPAGGSGAIWIYISVLSALWLNLVFAGFSPLNFSGARGAILWLGIAPLAAPAGWREVAEVAALGLILVVVARGLRWRQAALWLVLPAMGVLGFHGWGWALVWLRPLVQTVTYGGLAAGWLIVGLLGGLFSTRARRPWVMTVVFALPGLLSYPTNHLYGFSGTLVPLVFCWFWFYAVSAWRDGALRLPDGTWNAAAVRRFAFAGAVIFLLLQSFAATEMREGYFSGWRSILPDAWGARNLVALMFLAFLAKAVIFFPRWPGLGRLALGAGLILLLVLLEGQIWRPVNRQWMWLLGGLAAAWWADRGGRTLFGTAFFFVLYYYCTSLTPRSYLETGCLVGALAMGARLTGWLPQPENRRFDYVVLALLGLMVAGWAFARWTVSELEWHVVYQWFNAQLVERQVVFFVPFIALKFLAPWALIVWVLRAEFAGRMAFPAHALLLVYAAKMISVLAVNNGLGGADAFNRSYLEGACVSALMAVLFLGIILLRASWPEPATPKPSG